MKAWGGQGTPVGKTTLACQDSALIGTKEAVKTPSELELGHKDQCFLVTNRPCRSNSLAPSLDLVPVSPLPVHPPLTWGQGGERGRGEPQPLLEYQRMLAKAGSYMHPPMLPMRYSEIVDGFLDDGPFNGPPQV